MLRQREAPLAKGNRQDQRNSGGNDMFLKQTVKRNPMLVETGFDLMRRKEILPDTYVVDTDAYLANAAKILAEGKRQGVDLYFMLKQTGRSPWLARELVKLGYAGAVAVDFREAQVLMDHGIPICNVGHLVQCPRGFLKEIVAYEPAYMTVFSLAKIREIDREAAAQGKTMKLLLKVVQDQDMLYSGQTAGFSLDELPALLDALDKLEHVQVAGVTSFPAFLFDEARGQIEPTHNLETLAKARQILADRGIEEINVNAPSATCVRTLQAMKDYPFISSAEPGHGLSGSTPLHVVSDEPEIPAVVYMSEVSNNFRGHSYCYGGGHYRRSHVHQALVGPSLEEAVYCRVQPPQPECIDYYFELEKEMPVSDAVCMAFRHQIFVTRSHVVLVKGIQSGRPVIVGEYDSQGRKLA